MSAERLLELANQYRFEGKDYLANLCMEILWLRVMREKQKAQ